MCGRIFCLFNSKEEFIAEINEEEFDEKIDSSEFEYTGPRFNIPPTTAIPVLDSSFKMKSKNWGFKVGKIHVINARNEEVETKKSFKNLLDTQRCIIICSGYYEWHTTKGSNKKLAYSFKPKDSNVFFIAALYDPKSDSVVLMTREAVPSILKIHTRMPVLLRHEDISKWLNYDKYKFGQLQKQLIDNESYDSFLQPTALAPHVNSIKNSGPECLQSLEEYKQQSFSQGIGKFFAKKPKLSDDKV